LAGKYAQYFTAQTSIPGLLKICIEDPFFPLSPKVTPSPSWPMCVTADISMCYDHHSIPKYPIYLEEIFTLKYNHKKTLKFFPHFFYRVQEIAKHVKN